MSTNSVTANQANFLRGGNPFRNSQYPRLLGLKKKIKSMTPPMLTPGSN